MSRVTRFAARDPGPAARVSGFLAHLRAHGFKLGIAETNLALDALAAAGAIEPNACRSALRTVCCGCAEEVDRFDDAFDAFWLSGGRVRQRLAPSPAAQSPSAPHLRSSRKDRSGPECSSAGAIEAPSDDAHGGIDADGHTGKLQASSLNNLMKRDLRELVSPDDIRAAELVAHRLGQALRDRRSRRRKAARRGYGLDFRRTIRRSLGAGGEPLHPIRRKRPDRPTKIVALCDVSGSMLVYARPFLAFLAGLLRADTSGDAYLFHTKLVRITDALRDPDPLRAVNRVTLLADGIGGGSHIGACLGHFGQGYARRFVDGRSVVMILSDGYDTAPAQGLVGPLEAIKRRGAKVIWLNPLKGWAGYEPVARAMATALPHLDHFAAASTLDDLAALDTALEKL
ncbi:MAG: VWA domain-containing protein [Pseudomonadota bacterium]